MAYSAPELLLVGAAQNLVLTTSSPERKGVGLCSTTSQPDADSFDPLEYDESDAW